jgi:hypothetical protein
MSWAKEWGWSSRDEFITAADVKARQQRPPMPFYFPLRYLFIAISEIGFYNRGTDSLWFGTLLLHILLHI